MAGLISGFYVDFQSRTRVFLLDSDRGEGRFVNQVEELNMAIRTVREKEGKAAPEFPEVPAPPSREELAAFPPGYNVLGQEVALAGAGGWIQEAPPGVGLHVGVGRQLVLSKDWEDSIRASVAYGTSYRRGEEELKPPPSLLAFDVDQVGGQGAPVAQVTPGGPGSGSGMAPVEHVTPGGPGSHTGVENPPTTLAEDVVDNVEPVTNPGDEVTRDWNNDVSLKEDIFIFLTGL